MATPAVEADMEQQGRCGGQGVWDVEMLCLTPDQQVPALGVPSVPGVLDAVAGCSELRGETTPSVPRHEAANLGCEPAAVAHHAEQARLGGKGIATQPSRCTPRAGGRLAVRSPRTSWVRNPAGGLPGRGVGHGTMFAGWQEEAARRAAAKERERAEKARKAAAAKAAAKAKAQFFPLPCWGFCLSSGVSGEVTRDNLEGAPRTPSSGADQHPGFSTRMLCAESPARVFFGLGGGPRIVDANSRDARRRPRPKPRPKTSGDGTGEPKSEMTRTRRPERQWVHGALVREPVRGQVKAAREEALAKERDRKKKEYVDQKTGREQYARMAEARPSRILASGTVTAPTRRTGSRNPKKPTENPTGKT